MLIPLRKAGFIKLIGKDMLFPTLPVAEEAYLGWLAQQEPVVVPPGRQDVPSSDEPGGGEPEEHPRPMTFAEMIGAEDPVDDSVDRPT